MLKIEKNGLTLHQWAVLASVDFFRKVPPPPIRLRPRRRPTGTKNFESPHQKFREKTLTSDQLCNKSWKIVSPTLPQLCSCIALHHRPNCRLITLLIIFYILTHYCLTSTTLDLGHVKELCKAASVRINTRTKGTLLISNMWNCAKGANLIMGST